MFDFYPLTTVLPATALPWDAAPLYAGLMLSLLLSTVGVVWETVAAAKVTSAIGRTVKRHAIRNTIRGLRLTEIYLHRLRVSLSTTDRVG